MDRRARAAGDSSDGSSSSSSSDSVLIPMPLDQRHRKKLQAQLQLEQQKQQQQQQQQQQKLEARYKKDKQRKKARDAEHAPAKSYKPKTAIKSERICVVCERGDGAPLVSCTGPCVSAFHVACLPRDEQAGAQSSFDAPADAPPWLCGACRAHRHECFHCKEVGPEQAADDGAWGGAGSVGDSAPTPKGPVRKCRALSCGKYYHLDCITQFPLARIAGTHFICPLHTCAGCVMSGAQKDAVRCVRCPVAYHASCLPAKGVRQLTSKLIVCPSHSETPAPADAPMSAARDRERTSSGRRQRSSSVDVVKKESVAAGDKDESSGRGCRRLDEIVREDGAESEASERSAVSSASATDKKHKAKKEKRDKKKKKKKKKKMKRKDSRGRLAYSSQDEESAAASGEERDRASRKMDSSSRRGSFEEAGGSRAVDKELKRELSEEADADTDTKLAVVAPSSRGSLDGAASATRSSPFGGDSPSLKASLLFESPATTKQRLVEALGNSDEEMDEDDALRTADGASTSKEPPVARAASVQASIVEVELEDKPSAAGAEDDGKSLQKDSRDSKSKPVVLDRPSLPLLPSERIELKPDSEAPDASPGVPTPVNVSGDSSIGRLLNPPTPSVKQEQTDDADPQKADRLAVKIPKSASASSLAPSTSNAARPVKESVSEGEEGDDEGPGGATTPRSRRLARVRAEQSAVSTPRGASRSSGGSKKKKKKGKASKAAAESDNDAAGGDELAAAADEGAAGEGGEAKWVQCDNCKKWRTVPQSIDLASMPERWYCHMNAWNLAFASCDVAEEDAKQRTPQKAPPPLSLASERAKKKSKKKKGSALGGTGSDGGSSSSSSAAGKLGKDAGSTSAAAAAVAAATTAALTPDASDASAPLTAKQLKKQEKQEKRKKRKLSKIKDKYRELKWVQCESAQCGKWRVVPASIEFDLLPARWYCHLNTWSPELAKCSAPNPPEVEAFLLKQAAKDASVSPAAGARSHSNKRLKPAASAVGDGGPAAAQAAAGASGDGSSGVADASGGHEAGHKPAKASKSAKASAPTSHPASSGSAQQQGGLKTDSSRLAAASSAGATVLSAVAVATGTTPHAMDTKTSAFQAGRASKSSGSGSTGAGGQVKKTVLEWVECEKCKKWRKLPSHIKSTTLPDKWYCSMNHWDPARAKCSIPEEVEPEPLAVGPIPGTPGWYHGSVGSTKTGGGVHVGSKPRHKLSYSELLYASTGQLRKTYTPESSTLSFEYEGVTYRRDDMYKDSSLYVSPDTMKQAIDAAAALEAPSTADISVSVPANAALPAAWLGLALATATSDRGGSAISSTTIGMPALLLGGTGDQEAKEPAVTDRIASAVLAAMDLRRDWSVSDLLDKMNAAPEDEDKGGAGAASGGGVSLPLLAVALGELECKGLIERLDEEQSRTWKRRKTDALGDAASHDPVLLYRKVPSRPLKATKWWRSAPRANASPLPTN